MFSGYIQGWSRAAARISRPVTFSQRLWVAMAPAVWRPEKSCERLPVVTCCDHGVLSSWVDALERRIGYHKCGVFGSWLFIQYIVQDHIALSGFFWYVWVESWNVCFYVFLICWFAQFAQTSCGHLGQERTEIGTLEMPLLFLPRGKCFSTNHGWIKICLNI